MNQQTIPPPVTPPLAGASRPAREIEIRNWRPLVKDTLRGFFTAVLPSGMILHDLILREKNDARWINFPSRAFQGADGVQRYRDQIEFTDRQTADNFRDLVLAALDRHFGE